MIKKSRYNNTWNKNTHRKPLIPTNSQTCIMMFSVRGKHSTGSIKIKWKIYQQCKEGNQNLTQERVLEETHLRYLLKFLFFVALVFSIFFLLRMSVLLHCNDLFIVFCLLCVWFRLFLNYCVIGTWYMITVITNFVFLCCEWTCMLGGLIWYVYEWLLFFFCVLYVSD